MRGYAYYRAFAFVVLSLVLLTGSISAFEYSGYCQKMCMWGRGGNLCKCNAVHFAGKRGSSITSGQLADSPLQSAEDGQAPEELEGRENTLLEQEGRTTDLRPRHYKVFQQWLADNAQPDNQLTNTRPSALANKSKT